MKPLDATAKSRSAKLSVAVFLGAIILTVGSARSALAGIAFYDVVSGAHAATFNPTLSGGDFNGQSIGDLSIDDIAGVRDYGASELVLLGPSGLGFYNVVSGAHAATFNPTLSGGDFSGLPLSALSINSIVGTRDLGASELALIGPSGISYYNVVSGSLSYVFNPALSGGDFSGLPLSALSINNIVGTRDMGASELALIGPSGISYYNVVSGSLSYVFNPTLAGGHFSGMALSALSINNIAGTRDLGASELALFVPEPSTFVLAGLGVGILGCTGWRRSRRLAK